MAVVLAAWVIWVVMKGLAIRLCLLGLGWVGLLACVQAGLSGLGLVWFLVGEGT